MELKPNSERGRRAIIVLWITLVMQILGLLIMIVFDAENKGLMILGFVSLILAVFTIVCFIQWFRRAYYNLHMHSTNLSFSEGWAAGGWFVPFANLYIPYQIMKEMHIKAHKLVADADKSFDNQPPIGKINLWWILWMISNILSFTISLQPYFSWRLTSVELTLLNIFLSALSITSLLNALKIVKIYQDLELRMEQITPEQLGDGDINKHLVHDSF